MLEISSFNASLCLTSKETFIQIETFNTCMFQKNNTQNSDLKQTIISFVSGRIIWSFPCFYFILSKLVDSLQLYTLVFTISCSQS